MIRPFEEKDRRIYLEMAEEFYETNAVLHKAPKENFIKTFNAIMENSPYIKGYILEHNKEIAGFALVCPAYSNEAGGLTLWLEELFVKSKFQGKGLGRAFFSFIEEEAAGFAKRLRLEVHPQNTRAIALYRKLAYEELPYTQMVKDNFGK